MRFSDAQIDALRERVRGSMSDYRFTHTAEVEKMAARIGELYAPDKLDILRAAALLHDVTKELKRDEQIEMLRVAGEDVTALELASHKTFHARTAVYAILRDYPEFADGELLSAVRYHTTGRADMSICEKIIFLADYIDMSRTFEDCVHLREYFFDAEPEKMSKAELLRHLDSTLILSYDITVSGLMFDGLPISEETFKARNELVLSLMKK